ncbi:MAG: mandelate racemase/muconate lactonizing enzyme family protein [Acetobacterales bacterium]
MKIAKVEPILINIPYRHDGPLDVPGHAIRTSLDFLFVRVETDDGTVGWGEAFDFGFARTTRSAILDYLAPRFVGQDARNIVALSDRMQHQFRNAGRGGPLLYGLSGIEIALWDIAGKEAGKPLCELLGGPARTTLPAYASLARFGEPEAVGRNVAAAVAAGYKWIKLHEHEVAETRAAREAMGPDLPLLLDTQSPWNVAEAIDAADALAEFDPYWIEEPVWPVEDFEGLAKVAEEAGVAIAAGENAATLIEFRRMFEAGAVSFVQPSITKVGGIHAMQRIIALADAWGVTTVPHCPYHGAGLVATLHVLATRPQAVPVEHGYFDFEAHPYGDALAQQDGMLTVPDGPGLGIEPNLAVLERYRVD